jgi:hypothetical protein
MPATGTELSLHQSDAIAAANFQISPPAVSWRQETRTVRISRYLEGLAGACLEAARDPRLLGVLLGVLRLAPRTILQLARAPGASRCLAPSAVDNGDLDGLRERNHHIGHCVNL